MSILRYERCPLCGGTLATQAEDGPIHRYDKDHEHIGGAPSLMGRPILGGRDE